MKCLILAAGDGSRIAEKGNSKPLLSLAVPRSQLVEELPRLIEQVKGAS